MRRRVVGEDDTRTSPHEDGTACETSPHAAAMADPVSRPSRRAARAISSGAR